MQQMIALDLDNTLFNSAKEISPRNERVLKRVHQAGVKVVLCTGRPINAIRNYLDQLELNQAEDYTINFNGGLVTNNQTGEFLFQKGLVKSDLDVLYEFVMAHQLPLDVLDFDKVYEIKTGQQSLYGATVKGIDFTNDDYQDLPARDKLYSKAVIAVDPAQMAQVKALVRDDDQIGQHFTVVQSQPHILEFIPLGLNKAVGLQHLLEHFEMTFADLTAFGDADNDKEMLAAAGDGVVMANGLPAVKAIADHETLSNDEDGVAVYIENKFVTLLQ